MTTERRVTTHLLINLYIYLWRTDFGQLKYVLCMGQKLSEPVGGLHVFQEL